MNVRIDGVPSRIRKPRVRRYGPDGSSEEVRLCSYAALRQADDLRLGILRAMTVGVSSRDVAELYPESTPSRSAVSRAWIVEGRKQLEEFRRRNIADEQFFCLVLDGIVLSDDLTAIAALGITISGRKVMLDFEIGAGESSSVCDALLNRLVERGLRFAGPALFVLDGSEALGKSVRRRFPDVWIQRCLVHKERNVKGYLSKRHHGAVSRHFSRLRNVEGEEAAREVLEDLRKFLSRSSRKALESVDEAGDDLITLHRLGAPSPLHTTFLSTNCIENSYRNLRGKTGRVTRWRGETDQAERWLAYALTTAEKGFRRIRGYRYIPELLRNMGWPEEVVGASLRDAPAARAPGSDGPPPTGHGNLTQEEL